MKILSSKTRRMRITSIQHSILLQEKLQSSSKPAISNSVGEISPVHAMYSCPCYLNIMYACHGSSKLLSHKCEMRNCRVFVVNASTFYKFLELLCSSSVKTHFLPACQSHFLQHQDNTYYLHRNCNSK